MWLSDIAKKWAQIIDLQIIPLLCYTGSHGDYEQFMSSRQN